MKSRKGITLIALVVTIIVLLILAGISISMITGNNSIISRASEAKEKTIEAQKEEELAMEIFGSYDNDGVLNVNTLKSNLEKMGANVSGTEFPLSVKYNGQDYQVTSDGNLTDIDKPIEKNIIDYDVDLGIDIDGRSQYDWEYFYNDGNNVYIIAEDYISMNSSLLSNSLGNTNEAVSSHPYSFFYDMQNSDETIINNGKTGSIDLFGNDVSASNKFIPDKYLISWKEKVQNSPTTANNAKFVAMMMDTAKWENFANSTKIKTELGTEKPEELLATGGPTLEMWIKSWNERHGNPSNDENKIQLEYACTDNGVGYIVQKENGEWNYGLDLSSNSTGLEDKLYFPHTSNYNECYGYWIISPSAVGYNSLMRIGYNGELGQDGCGNWWFGIRPVVCLPSDITAKWNQEKNIWEIKK